MTQLIKIDEQPLGVTTVTINALAAVGKLNARDYLRAVDWQILENLREPAR